MRKRDLQIFVLLCIAGLSAAVVWLSLSDRGQNDSRIPALQRQGATLTTELNELRAATAKSLAARSPRLAALERAKPIPRPCLKQIQAEIDALRGFIASGTAIRKRVTAECQAVLAPRFGG